MPWQEKHATQQSMTLANKALAYKHIQLYLIHVIRADWCPYRTIVGLRTAGHIIDDFDSHCHLARLSTGNI